ncbi:TlpA disulfide reductase family protein [Demequina sp. SYSU T00039]|uniref:TlpA disulfide reductase family protein n=1 Tax=Demequina lignilytica TaxID=3051663 RepID=A0AAW7M764_9MICO|nr:MULTISPECIES: TlpA disulfide reductase family protein [unclassified Demequina]MDN4478014.1 TlpA disulfide reductase family protein [Demequina sp. SYSU T00039-1]MDN4488536.1 TlpA disulfide reductase family protein [Demequina sp. SYSU T00039]MDN4489917.1 TlpA disulfide reductase family protein [Demequina sp. SYSU T00068]
MRPAARIAILIAVVVALVITLASCAGPDAAQSPGYVSGDGTVTVLADQGDALDLAGTSFAGEAVDVADFRGQVVLVNTWYASCPPCRAEAPDLVALDARDDVQIVGVNGRDDAPTVEAFDRTFGVEFPSIDDADGAATAALQGVVAMNAVPTTLVLDPDGRLYARIVGRADPSTLSALIEDALAEGA